MKIWQVEADLWLLYVQCAGFTTMLFCLHIFPDKTNYLMQKDKTKKKAIVLSILEHIIVVGIQSKSI